jgi:hypothetical protein
MNLGLLYDYSPAVSTSWLSSPNSNAQLFKSCFQPSHLTACSLGTAVTASKFVKRRFLHGAAHSVLMLDRRQRFRPSARLWTLKVSRRFRLFTGWGINSTSNHQSPATLILGFCILLRVWDQGERFSSTQRYFCSFSIYSLSCYMFRSYDHLQEPIKCNNSSQ